ncbi:PHP domain-containing protein [Chloroflexus sp.]|uniref:PHP domain-containing protein n=1 Tax=Chloroflexus sp. TaxID=1904827 RepID=UPI002ACE61BD|nr:PHP domain-containing protein [Chloroflexus sp.]
MISHYNAADLHIHTTASDGAASPEAVLSYVAEETDLRVIAITDHNTLEGAFAARRLAPRYGIDVIVGCEISTAIGHVLALFIEKPIPAGIDLATTVRFVHEQGGLAFAAHPFGALVASVGRRHLLGPERTDLDWHLLDGLEVFNASLWNPANNRRAAQKAQSLGLTQIGGSDAHDLAMIGYGRTLFAGTSAADLRRALQRGETQVIGHYWGWRGVAGVVRKRALRSRPFAESWAGFKKDSRQQV